MITKQQKKEIINDLKDRFSRQKSIVFSDYSGLTVNQIQELRKQLKEHQIDYRVAKKTLMDLALKEVKLDKVKVKDLDGQVSVAIGYDDEVLPAKILYDFSKENENLKLLAGFIDGEYLDNDNIIKIANLPSRQELLAKLAGSISSPFSGLLNALQGNIRKLVYSLEAIKNNKQGLES